jgi:ADP-heptose:LPS heptosyltransferase
MFFVPIFRFVGEFCPFLHLGFTYTTYITVNVKSKFFIIEIRKFDSKKKKIRDSKFEKTKRLGCAIHMKEYRIMMDLPNQIPW